MKKITDMLKRLFWLVFIFLGCTLFFGVAAFSQGTETQLVSSDEIINQDLYLRGETVVIDGTVNGNAFLAGKDVTINGTVTNDVYLAGQTVTIAGTVGGDATTAGRKIVMQGKVAADLNAAGQSLIIDGSIGDDARLAGQILQFNENTQIDDNVVAAGASLSTDSQTRIGGNLNLAVGQAVLSGTVDKNLVGGMGAAQLSGTVGEDANLIVGADKPDIPWPDAELKPVDIPIGLTLSNSAQILGNLSYESPQEANISEAAQVQGELSYREIEFDQAPQFLSRGWGIALVQRFLSLLLVGALLLWLQPQWIQSLVDNLKAQPWLSLCWGALGIIIISVGAVAIAAITLLSTALLAFVLPGLALPAFGVGASTTLALWTGVGIFVAFIAQIVISVWGGKWLMTQLMKAANQRFASLALGLLLYVFFSSIPGLGVLINLVVSLLGLGGLWLWFRTRQATHSTLTLES